MGIVALMMLVSFVWGLSEATVFFIIPDVVLTAIAIQGFKRGLAASTFALVGALFGGGLMYWLATGNMSTAYQIVSQVPAIHVEMLQNVKESLKDGGVLTVIIGPIRGIPYKTFAIMAPSTGISFSTFLLASIPARFIRFFLTSTLAWFLANVCFKRLPLWSKYVVWLVIWIMVYVIYFSIHPW